MVLEDLRTHCPDVRDLASMYEEGKSRPEVYRQISELLVAEARRQPGVAFVVHGHPLFLVSAAEYTLALAREHGLRVRVLPAVSSFDTILCDLEIDYGYGLQIFDATTMIRNGWRPNPAIPLLIFQLATLLTDAQIRGSVASARLEPLVDYLAQGYPRDHVCTVVYTGSHLMESSLLVAIPLSDLSSSDKIELWKRPTLYVPPVT